MNWGKIMTELEIQAFLTIIKLGSISAAAESLYVTQPALSRRIHALEAELGYKLINRKKGIRISELTEEGKAFVPIAEKYKTLLQEAKYITKIDRSKILNISSIGSVSSYILPDVFSCFMNTYPEYNVNFYNYHSYEAYDYVSKGEVDIALISDDMFFNNIETIPIFKEAMLLVTSYGSKYNGELHPSVLDVADEIRLPWNPEYDLWNNFWFRSTLQPKVFLDQMSLLEYFMRQENVWAIVPVSVAYHLKEISNIEIHYIKDAPPDRFIYYLVKESNKQETIAKFLALLNKKLLQIKGLESLIK